MYKRQGEAFARVEKEFANKAQGLKDDAAKVEERLARAFEFVEAAFGDQQELLVFTTELTSRTVTARYLAQYGSPSYFAHNEDMILSERQRDLRHRIEELGL